MTGIAILDSHHHLWDTAVVDYSLFQTIERLNRPFTAAEFEGEAAPLGIAQSICVEAASAGADGRLETEWLLAEANRSERIIALVAWAPLEQPDLVAHLDWLATLDRKPIVGVRRSFEFEPDDFPSTPAVVEGARVAGERGLAVDLVLFSRSLAATTVLVESCPQTQFVLDHLGKPPIREGRFEPWAGQLRELARLPNIVCKLSGLATEADRTNWGIDDLRPYVEQAFDCFGSERILFATDWPVVELAGGAGRWLAAARELLAELDKFAQAAVFGENARRIYGLS